MTFCVSINCPYRFNCKRNVINNKFDENELVSQCNFEHTDTKCDYFIKKQEEQKMDLDDEELKATRMMNGADRKGRINKM